jgi:hypothetical protein
MKNNKYSSIKVFSRLGTGGSPCNPGYSGGRDQDWGSIKDQSQPRQIVHETLSQKYPTHPKKTWQSGSSGRAPASLALRPELKPSTEKKCFLNKE